MTRPGTHDPLEVILRVVSDGITTMTPDGSLIYANEIAARTGGESGAGRALSYNRPISSMMIKITTISPTMPEGA